MLNDDDPAFSEESGSEYGTDETASDESESDGSEANNSQENEPSVQAEIAVMEGDFSRLVDGIRNAPDPSNNAILSKIWDRPTNYDVDEQFKSDLRAASGIGKSGKGKGKGRRGRRHGPALSHEVRALIGEGNQACVDGILQDAIRIMTEVIRIEPRVPAAYSVLSMCYRDLGERQKALTFAIFGAHLRHDSEEWHSLAKESRELGLLDQALVCLTRATKLEPDNLSALWDRALLAQELEYLPIAKNSYLALLKHIPYDTGVLAELRHILVELDELKLCTDLYQQAFDHYTSTDPKLFRSEPISQSTPHSDNIDPSLASTSDYPITETTCEFTLIEILVLADLYNTLGKYEKAIKTIRAGSRWLGGRASQKYWDACIDDREFDPEGVVRGNNEENSRPSFMRQGFYPLDINARHRLAIARLKLGDTEEGQMHAEIILAQKIEDFAPLFAEIADAYFDMGFYAEAKPVYETLGADAATSSMHVLVRTADCRRFLEDFDGAQEVYEHIVSVDPSNSEVKMKLAEIYELKGQPRRALDLVYQVIDARKRVRSKEAQDGSEQQEDQSGQVSLFTDRRRAKGKYVSKSKQSGLSREQLIELERQKHSQSQEWYQELKDAEGPMRVGIEEAIERWLLFAEKLVEMFRETRKLFPARTNKTFSGFFGKSRRKQISSQSIEVDEENIASRLEQEIDEEAGERASAQTQDEGYIFRGIHFDDWLTLAMEYAFILTRRDQYDLAEEILRHLLLSRVYQGQQNQDTLRLSIITCALYARKHSVCLEMCRKLMLTYQFNNEPYRIFLATLASGLASAETMMNPNLQKFLLREARISTAAVDGKVRWMRRYALSEKQTAVEEPDDAEMDNANAEGESNAKEGPKPTRYNPVLPTVHAQSLIMSKSYQSGIFHLLQAYDSCPTDPVICLTLAVASLGRAMQRQSDNRNYLIVQAFGFLTQYRKARGTSSDDPLADEVEYNYGRAFHQIGLYSHAIKHYERVLTIVEKRLQSGETDYGIAREAAYNLSSIYVVMNAMHVAKEVRMRWLSF